MNWEIFVFLALARRLEDEEAPVLIVARADDLLESSPSPPGHALQSAAKYPLHDVPGSLVYSNLDNLPWHHDYLETRRRDPKKWHRDRKDQYFTEDDSEATTNSESDDDEKSPDNPYTVHKNRYTQNWLWNFALHLRADKFDLKQLSSYLAIWNNSFGADSTILSWHGSRLLLADYEY